MADFLEMSSVWGVVLTLVVFAGAVWINRKTGAAWCNPLLLSSIFIIVFLTLAQIPYANYRSSVEIIHYLLFPATVSLAIPLYEQWQLLKENALAILAGIAAGVVTSLVSILLLGFLFRLEPELIVTLLPKSVTTAIGMDVSMELGGLASLTSAVIVMTGILGNLMAQSICKIFHLTNPIARGVAIGTSSHAIGTARALQMGPVEGAMSSLSIAVAGILTALLCPLLAPLLYAIG